MNFFFQTHTDYFRSTLTIPKFQNNGHIRPDLSLFRADIRESRWCLDEVKTKNDPNFWTIAGTKQNADAIYCICSKAEAELITSRRELINLNNFTSTFPDFRANLSIESVKGGFSSYQSDYPFRMTTKLASLYSDCSTLTFENCQKVGVFIRNIFYKPVQKKATLFLYDDLNKCIVEEFSVYTNRTTYIDLTKNRSVLSNCFVFADKFIGLPVYVVEFNNNNLSFEHTHPPHTPIGGKNRFSMVGSLKRSALEKVT